MLKNILVLLIIFCLGAAGAYVVFYQLHSKENDEFAYVKQTSGEMLFKYSHNKSETEGASENDKKQHLLVSDIYIKSWSYAWLNKIFFVLSVVFAILVLAWPTAVILLKNVNNEKTKAIFGGTGATVIQTTVTALAAFMFTFYSQYKDKQTYSENLIRSVIYSNEPDIAKLAVKVTEELAKIDRGFVFSSIVEKE